MRTQFTTLAVTLLAASLSSQTITRISSPAIGRPFTIEYTSSPGNLYAMLFGAVPLTSQSIPGIGGTLYLPIASLINVYSRTVPASGVDPVIFVVPNNPALLGGSLALQAADAKLPATVVFSTNAVELCVNNGVGTLVLAEATNTATTTGDLQLSTVQNLTTGAPVAQSVPKGVPQAIYHFSKYGFTEVSIPQSTSSVELADLDVDTGLGVQRSCHDTATQHMQLPNGFDLYVMRDLAKPKEFFLMSVNRATGQASELTGSRCVDTSATAQPASNYQAQLAFTDDGAVGIAVQGDTNNNPVGNVGVADRIVLIKTDPSQTWGNGKNVIDVSPPPGPNALFTQYNGTLRICNGMGFLEGEEPSGATGEAALWGGRIDGSAQWSRITVPLTGTSQNWYWSYSVYRSTADGKVNVFLGGGPNATSTLGDMDVYAMRNISTSTAPVVLNITKFPTSTQLPLWGTSSVGTTANAQNGANPALRASLSPDGTRVAFVMHLGTAVAPSQIAIARTDGSDAGVVNPFTAGKFDPQIVQFSELWWLSNTRLLFAAGSAPTTGAVAQAGFDLYVYDTATTTITPVSKTTTGSLVQPFTAGGTAGNLVIRSSFMSKNGIFYYFVRQSPNAATVQLANDIVGVNLASLKLFDVTGSEFSSGTAPSIRGTNQVSPYAWLMRRAIDNQIYFACAKNTGLLTTFADDELWRFNPEAGSQAVQLTSYNGTSTSTANVRQIGELRLSVDGKKIAYSVGVGTATTNTEDLYLIATTGGAPVRLTRQPASGVIAIRRGSIFFTPTPMEGVAWTQGNNSRSVPTLATAAYWNTLLGNTAPLLLGTAPSATLTKNVLLLSAGSANP